jgi:hypothetical protein
MIETSMNISLTELRNYIKVNVPQNSDQLLNHRNYS